MTQEKLLAALVAALAFNELVHIVFEIWGARQKVAWLRARMDKQSHGDWPLNINSLTKTIVLHLVLFGVFVGVMFAVFTLLNIPVETLLKLSVGLLIVTYAYTVFGMDAYHSEVGQLVKRYKRQK